MCDVLRTIVVEKVQMPETKSHWRFSFMVAIETICFIFEAPDLALLTRMNPGEGNVNANARNDVAAVSGKLVDGLHACS
ncbi:hypothetical protein VARIO8X_60118 [Burkholderiales bacterium 8X]|nr:hypothetical protein VARIO8X_60118 [Burkholderiales bacterium 8X]